MQLNEYLSGKRGRQAELAKALGVHAPDITRWINEGRPIPFKYGAAIEQATGGLVTRQEMFPDDWQTVWPELVGQKSGRRSTDKKT